MSPALERPPLAAGEFYPADPGELTRALSELFAGVRRLRLSRPPLLLVTPHSALDKSGAVAAAAFAHLLGQKYDAVVIIAPSHAGHFPGASVYDGERYCTPLGELPVERTLASEIAQLTPPVKLSSRGHAIDEREFTIEVTLPFLQLALGTTPIVPIITGDQEIPSARALGDSLYSALKQKNALVIVSTDLSHYHDLSEATVLDQLTTQTALAVDPERLINLYQAGRVEACGVIGLIAALIYAQRMGVSETEQALYQHSEVSDDEVIGHAALIYTRSARRTVYSAPKKPEKKDTLELDDNDKRELKAALREALIAERHARATGGASKFAAPEPTSRALSDARGVFVSVTLEGDDLGRAGFLRTRQSLFTTALEAAITAVFSEREPTDDPTAEDIQRMKFSLLLPSPLRRIEAISEFTPETQGALVRLELHSAHLAPDEFKRTDGAITSEAALEQVCLKAQLPRKSYTDPLAEVYCFDVVTVDL